MIDNGKTGNKPDAPWRERGIGMAILTRTCGQCMKPRSSTGGSIRYVRGLLKKAFVCAGCVEKTA